MHGKVNYTVWCLYSWTERILNYGYLPLMNTSSVN